MKNITIVTSIRLNTWVLKYALAYVLLGAYFYSKSTFEILMYLFYDFTVLKECLVHIEALKKSVNCFSLNNASLWHKESHLINGKSLPRWLNIHIERRLKTICMNISAVMISGWWDYEWFSYFVLWFSESSRYEHLLLL